ncbi:MAG TPA: DUF4038 domain-containing protein [Thermoanaerobaculia bacterium]
MRNHLQRCLLLFALTITFAFSAVAQDVGARGARFDKALVSNANHDWLSPTAKLCVRYTSPTGAQYNGLGFWHSRSGTQDTFRIRGTFNETGLWSWALIGDTTAGCLATGTFPVNSGTINVGVAPAGNALYAEGPIRVDASQRYLTRQNGGSFPAFMWIGDTSWGGAHKSTLASWQTYTNNRRNKNYSVIQVSAPLSGSGAPTDAAGNAPFTGVGCTSGVLPRAGCLPNPLFWNAWDDHINDVNAKSMYVTVVGLFKRVNEGNATWPTVAHSKAYARFLAARLAGNHAAVSPGFDELPGRFQSVDEVNCGEPNVNMACRAKQVGIAIKEALFLQAPFALTTATTPRTGTPLSILVTHHIGGGCNDGSDGTSNCLSEVWAARFQKEGWLDFQLIQSGQGVPGNCSLGQEICIAERSTARILRYYNLNATDPTIPVKPIVNGEGVYDNFGYKFKDNSPCAVFPGDYGTLNANYSAARARQVAFNSLLSGGAGYSLGVGGIWDWQGSFTCRTVAEGRDSQSSTQIGRIRTLFSALRWYRLQPDSTGTAHIKDADQAALPQDQKRVYAKDANGVFAVAYLPNNTSIRLNLSDLAGFTAAAPWKTEWYNAGRGTGAGGPCLCTANKTFNAGDNTWTFNRPAAGDWGLVIRNTNNIGGTLNLPECNPPVGGVVSCL